MAVLVIIALIGLILIVSGIVSFLSGGLPPTTGITFLVIGFICISVGTKGKCLWIPCVCAGGCDCDC